MKVIAVNHTDRPGGASKAALRIHQAVVSTGVASSIYVNVRQTDDPAFIGPNDRWARLWNQIAPRLSLMMRTKAGDANNGMQSYSSFGTSMARRLARADADVFHLHWICAETLSIAQVGRLQTPAIWTLHDMWPFCATEHYTLDEDYCWGYTRARSRADQQRRRTWLQKQGHWRNPIGIVSPSNWLAACARRSALMADWPIEVIPNAIDTSFWRPLNRGLCRQILGLPDDLPLVLFGAVGGGRDPRKGIDLLASALTHLKETDIRLHLAIFGQSKPANAPDFGFPSQYTGHLSDDVSMLLWYNAANLIVIPSRQDNLPNTGLEAHACGIPVVAFATGGLPDIVSHQATGYLARAFSTEDLAEGICWSLKREAETDLGLESEFDAAGALPVAIRGILGKEARRRAEALWSYGQVGPRYKDAYQRRM